MQMLPKRCQAEEDFKNPMNEMICSAATNQPLNPSNLSLPNGQMNKMALEQEWKLFMGSAAWTSTH